MAVAAAPAASAAAASHVTGVAAAPKDVIYAPITYGWEQNKEFVEVLCLDLKGVGFLPADAVACDFHPASFDLRIHGLNGKNYRASSIVACITTPTRRAQPRLSPRRLRGSNTACFPTSLLPCSALPALPCRPARE